MDEVRDDGVIAWEPYTDHHPVEVTLRTGKDWARQVRVREKCKETEAEPDWARLRGGTQAAAAMREALASAMDDRVKQMQGDDEWSEICEVSHEVALAVLGPRARAHPRPWLRGREKEKEEMDGDVQIALTRVREIRASIGNG
eukprot:10633927-Karenia_brevis.AAC.1